MVSITVKDSNNAVDNWFYRDEKKSAKTTAPNNQSGSSTNKGNVILGQTLSDIIAEVRNNFNLEELILN